MKGKHAKMVDLLKNKEVLVTAITLRFIFNQGLFVGMCHLPSVDSPNAHAFPLIVASPQLYLQPFWIIDK